MSDSAEDDATDSLWIFGYGSLVWRPAFAHKRHLPAFVEGFARRFWQGSLDHRGLPGQPGRVVTLIPETDPDVVNEPGFTPAPCWGTAYEVPTSDPNGVLAGLDHRERGGYDRLEVELTLVADPAANPTACEKVAGLVYIAHNTNANYLGPAPIGEIAQQVATARGPSGPNLEYVFELAKSLDEMGAPDPHVEEVAAAAEAWRFHRLRPDGSTDS